jgi:protein-tyrosine phosphatase
MRIHTLAGGLNFRDIGGYSTESGLQVRWRQLYRSGTTHALTQDDLKYIAASKIRHVYDLRSATERLQFPSRLQGHLNIEYWSNEYDQSAHDRATGNLMRDVRSPDISVERAQGLVAAYYRELPYYFREAYAALFRHLNDGDLPIVFSCTAGKDRTGVGAALVLSALGVPREIIAEDYRMTDPSCQMMLGRMYPSMFDGVKRGIGEVLMSADPSYLNIMFDQLTIMHGSVELFVRQKLGVTQKMIDRMRSRLLV